MGTNAVGGMIVAGPEGFVKNQYRKFNIKSTDITPGDDFGMMREVMQRRFSRLLKDHGDEGPVKPDRRPTTTPMPPRRAACRPGRTWC
jgi:excinuclease ABC subunit C